VQPDSEQTCLLGMNAIPELGIKLLCSNGEKFITQPAGAKVGSVCLVQTESILEEKGDSLTCMCRRSFKTEKI
jgi:hypothetical protein